MYVREYMFVLEKVQYPQKFIHIQYMWYILQIEHTQFISINPLANLLSLLLAVVSS